MPLSLRELRELAKKKWAESDITEKMAKQLHYEVLTADQVERLAPNFLAAGAIRIPYFTVDGKLTKFYRIRYIEELPGFAGAAEKPQRYAQAANTLNEVYAPPLLDRPWSEVLADAEVGVVFTEGEFKSACACAVGLATLGLGGVDVWRSSRRGLAMLRMLADVEWSGRNVCIVFDSDAAQNPNVVRAQRQLAHELADRGAMARIVSLPSGVNGRKVGLDDFIVANGVDAVRDLIESAPPWAEAAALWELSEECVYIRDPGLVLVRDTQQRVNASDFTVHRYANRHYWEQTEDGAKKRQTAKQWLAWPERFELARITYRPGQPKVVDDEWNLWEGWGCEPKPGPLKMWRELLDYMFDGSEHRRWFEQWLAYPLQHPGEKLFSAVAIWGVMTGTGKSLIGETMLRIYGKNGVGIGDTELRGDFNEWAANKQFVLGDEVTGNDKRQEADKLKRLITQPRMRINAKYVPTFFVPDCANYYFTSNHPDAFFLDDADRRFFIWEAPNTPQPDSFYQEYDRWYKNGGAGHLFHHLMQVDLKGFNPMSRPPTTSAKRAMIRDSKSDVGAWCLALREDPTTQLRAWNLRASAECDLLHIGQLHRAYDLDGKGKVTQNGLARELKKASFPQANRGEQVRTASGQFRLFIVRNQEKWLAADAAECATHWEKVFGPKTKGVKF